MHNTETYVTNTSEFYNLKFNSLDFKSQSLRKKTFECCRFIGIDFGEAHFLDCNFIDCEFVHCNLTSAVINGTSFNEVIFRESKLIGINWTQAKWPHIALSSPLKFYQSNLSHSNFYELSLAYIIIENCKAHNVDFREGDFSHACFIGSDLANSFFVHTKLYAADFTNAIHYTIDPRDNIIKKAKFSTPDVLNLLQHFEIEIEDF